MAGLEAPRGLGCGVPGGGQTLGVREEGPWDAEAGEQPLRENRAEGRPEGGQGEEAGWSWGDGEGAAGEGELGGEGPTWRWGR